MKQSTNRLRLELEVPPDTAEKCLLAAICEEYAHSDENAEAVLQTIPTELLARLRKRGLCLRQLARHLVKGDTVYEV